MAVLRDADDSLPSVPWPSSSSPAAFTQATRIIPRTYTRYLQVEIYLYFWGPVHRSHGCSQDGASKNPVYSSSPWVFLSTPGVCRSPWSSVKTELPHCPLIDLPQPSFRPLKHSISLFMTLSYSPATSKNMFNNFGRFWSSCRIKLFVKLEKIKFHVPAVSFLCFLLLCVRSHQMDPGKIRAVLDWPHLTSMKQVQCFPIFIGDSNFYRRFIWKLSSVAEPFSALTKKLVWNSRTNQAFNRLRRLFTCATILNSPWSRDALCVGGEYLRCRGRSCPVTEE